MILLIKSKVMVKIDKNILKYLTIVLHYVILSNSFSSAKKHYQYFPFSLLLVSFSFFARML